MNTVKSFIHLAKPFWWHKNAWREWFLLIAVIGFALAIVRVSVKITLWNKHFYDAIEQFDTQAVMPLIVQYLVYIILIVMFIVLGNWIRKILFFRWRQHLSEQFTRDWLHHSKAYRLQLNREPDNPDQRIAEDCAWLAEKSVDLCKYFIMNVAKLGAFIAVLWQLSGVQTVSFSGKTWQIHGYLVWIALIYSLLCTLATHWIGRRLHPLNVERQHREADYRATLLRVRDHAEQIAFYRGEQVEQTRLNHKFQSVKQNFHELIGRELRLETFSATYLRVSMFIPIIAALPLYLAKAMTFGDMMQARSAFSNVQDGFSWFMDYYKRIMEWAAVVSRLAHFQAALNQIPDFCDDISENQIPDSNGALLNIANFDLNQPDGTPLIRDFHLRAGIGERILLDGNSGTGKTTLLRALAGLWTYQHGTIQFSSSNRLFLPQRPYLPHGSLRQILCYPHLPPNQNQDNDLKQILEQVGLEKLSAKLDDECEWQRILSGGEQQRISFARALLVRPDILFMDETSNQLDDTAAAALHRCLQMRLPDTLIVATSHQNVVRALFTKTIVLTK